MHSVHCTHAHYRKLAGSEALEGILQQQKHTKVADTVQTMRQENMEIRACMYWT